MTNSFRVAPLAALLLLGACTTIPSGPSVMALPGTGKSFDQFRADDADCRQFALSQTGGSTANEAAIDSGVKSAALGTFIGALAGAAIGGRDGAGVGAGMGLVAGTAAGAGAGQASGYGSQRRYDHAYLQCMYAKGDRVPVPSGMMPVTAPAINPPQAPAGAYAPTPSGSPPPPPPGPPPPPPRGVLP